MVVVEQLCYTVSEYPHNKSSQLKEILQYVSNFVPGILANVLIFLRGFPARWGGGNRTGPSNSPYRGFFWRVQFEDKLIFSAPFYLVILYLPTCWRYNFCRPMRVVENRYSLSWYITSPVTFSLPILFVLRYVMAANVFCLTIHFVRLYVLSRYGRRLDRSMCR
jgi:hypothetical protein